MPARSGQGSAKKAPSATPSARGTASAPESPVTPSGDINIESNFSDPGNPDGWLVGSDSDGTILEITNGSLQVNLAASRWGSPILVGIAWMLQERGSAARYDLLLSSQGVVAMYKVKPGGDARLVTRPTTVPRWDRARPTAMWRSPRAIPSPLA